MPGALGCAMSHVRLWRQCAAGNEPFHIAEDDLFCRTDFAATAQACLDRLTDWDIVVWAYNLDWPVQARLAPGSGVTVVQYDYTSVHHDRFRAGRVTPFLAPLVSAAGTGCYSISPRGAARALADCLPIGNTGRSTFGSRASGATPASMSN